MARKKKIPVLILILVDMKNPNNRIEGTFMGMFEPDLVMVGTEDSINMYSLSEYLVFYIEDYTNGNYTYPSAMRDEQDVARGILDDVSKMMPTKMETDFHFVHKKESKA